MEDKINVEEIKNDLITQVAKTCHQVNKAYCASIGDESQPDWNDAPDWQKESAISGIKQILDFPGTNAEDLHANWMAEKEADGWTYHPAKDAEKKTHPCIVPYNMLPKNQRIKDDLFLAVVHSFIELIKTTET